MRSFQLPAILMLVISLAFATSCKPEEKQPEQSKTGVAGYEGKSKKNGKTIFLPYTGMRVEDKTASLDGGYYWSSSLAQAGSTSQALYIQMFDSRTPIPSGNNRCWGYAIRPVNK